jgi:hypothetical protein
MESQTQIPKWKQLLQGFERKAKNKENGALDSPEMKLPFRPTTSLGSKRLLQAFTPQRLDPTMDALRQRKHPIPEDTQRY